MFRPVSTDSKEAQLWFDRGLNWCYGYNYEEAVRCFRKASEFDPSCAMAYWGMAYASGSNYYQAWRAFGKELLKQVASDCYRLTQEAVARLDNTSALERALIVALPKRYQSAQVASNDEFRAWNDAFCAAMKEVYASFPDDFDICALYADVMINKTPDKLWDIKRGVPAEGADTVAAMDVLERALRQMEEGEREPHPGVMHVYIHTMEMSPFPERAWYAANGLRDMVPDAGHLQHMPSHIDILCGHYYDAVVANNKAIVADRKYLEREGPLNYYTIYRSHNYHFKLYAAMFLGQYKTAMDTVNEMIATIPEALLRVSEPPMADWLESFIGMKMDVLIRFGKWQEIINEPLPDDPTLYSVTTTMIHYAKGLAHAALGNVEAAEEEKQRFLDAFATVPETRTVYNNKCRDILAVAAEMLNGEIEYRKGNYEKAFKHLRQSVFLDDNLLYSEPWAWMQPTRHALGALLLEQGHVEEAEQVYRADLGLDNTLSRGLQHPLNLWSLHGYVEWLIRQNKHAEAAAAQARLNLAMAHADVPIHASCYCRGETSCCD